MLVLPGALLAGVLTTLAPCVLPLLPVIVGSSVVGSGGGTDAEKAAARALSRRRAYVITASLGVSIGAFTLLLKVSTALIGIDANVWAYISGIILIALGLVGLFPGIWEAISMRLSLQSRSSKRLAKARQQDGVGGQILTGAALGPVFSSCSPLYAYVIVTVLPAQFGYGLALLGAYLVGLCVTLLAISLAGQRLVRNVKWIADPHGWFRRGLGIAFIVVGIFVLTGLDKDLQTWILSNSPIRPWELDSGFVPE